MDYFVVYSHDLETLYLVPESEVGSSMALRVETPKQADPKINHAEAYVFDERWPPDADDTVSTAPRDETVRAVTGAFDALGATVYRADGERVCLVEHPDRGLLRIRAGSVSEQGNRLRTTALPDGTDDIDHYALYCPSREQTYLLNADEFGASVSLRTGELDQVGRDTRWAEDYHLETVWPPDETPSVTRNSAVGATLEAFENLGVTVGIVHDETATYDLLAETPTGIARDAVVPAWSARGCLRLKPQTKDGIDAFVVYHRETDSCYVVSACAFERAISLRIEEPAKPDSSITWADDHELAENWPP